MQAGKGAPKAVLEGIAKLHDRSIVHLGQPTSPALHGGDNWRSPEGHFKGKFRKSSDMYSFGLV